MRFVSSATTKTRAVRSAKSANAGKQSGGLSAFIYAAGATLTDEDRELTRRKLDQKLGKFSSAIQRVSVRLKDVNGPRGGVDQFCRVKVVLDGLPSVVFDKRDASPLVAIDDALTGAERAVRRTVQRRRMKPLKRRP